jgi:hypothetical protein
MIKKRVLLKTREDIERERMKIMSSTDDTTNISLPALFEIAIKLYNLIKNYPDFYQHSRLDELVELTFQRYRSILKVLSYIHFSLSIVVSSSQVIYRKILKLKI